MNKEELNNKLNMIFEELLEIHEKLIEQDMEKQRYKAKVKIEDAERHLKELDYRENRKWEDRHKITERFNERFEWANTEEIL